MKKYILIMFLMFVCITNVVAFDTNTKIYDYAQVLTAKEEKQLKKDVDLFIANSNMDMVLITVKHHGKKSTLDYADEFYDINGFGIGDTKDGVVAVIDFSSNNTEFVFSKYGKAIEIFDEKNSKKIIDTAKEKINKSYYKVLNSFIEETMDCDCLDNNVNYFDSDIVRLLKLILVSFIISIIISIILILRSINKKNKIDNDKNYIEKNTFEINKKVEKFRTTQTKSLNTRGEYMKKGFTLVELLAVIIVLAVISTIAVPIVMNIINNSTRSTNEASIELYGRAVEQATLEYELVTKSIATSFEDIKDYINYDGNKVECDTFSVEGSKVYLSECSVDDELVEDYEYGEIDVCALLSGKPNEIGSKYLCKVNEEEKYNFYVVSHELDETTNLIMDQNINSDGTPAGITLVTKTENATKYNLVEWNSSGQSAGGPVDAINFLYNATKSWTNIPALNYEYNDSEFQNYQNYYDEGVYISFVSINGVVTITPFSGDNIVIGTSEAPLRSRLPIYAMLIDETYSIIGEKGELTGTKDDNYNAFLYENIHPGYPLSSGVPHGYWALSTGHDTMANMQWHSGVTSMNANFTEGIRPVINVKL